jgi:hypothetical protein
VSAIYSLLNVHEHVHPKSDHVFVIGFVSFRATSVCPASPLVCPASPLVCPASPSSPSSPITIIPPPRRESRINTVGATSAVIGVGSVLDMTPTFAGSTDVMIYNYRRSDLLHERVELICRRAYRLQREPTGVRNLEERRPCYQYHGVHSWWIRGRLDVQLVR